MLHLIKSKMCECACLDTHLELHPLGWKTFGPFFVPLLRFTGSFPLDQYTSSIRYKPIPEILLVGFRLSPGLVHHSLIRLRFIVVHCHQPFPVPSRCDLPATLSTLLSLSLSLLEAAASPQQQYYKVSLPRQRDEASNIFF